MFRAGCGNMSLDMSLDHVTSHMSLDYFSMIQAVLLEVKKYTAILRVLNVLKIHGLLCLLL